MKEAIVLAGRRLSILKFYPADEYAKGEIMALLERICDSPDRLDWLVGVLIDNVGEWPGPAQLRALYATRWRPADGVEGQPCAIAGRTPADSESLSLAEHQEHKRIEAGDRSPVEIARLW